MTLDPLMAAVVTGICVNHDCPRFEFTVAAYKGARCETCEQLLLAPNGVDYPGESNLADTLRADDGALD